MNQAAIEELKKQVRGEVLQPADAGYDEARTIYNAMIDRRPAVIVRCSGTADAAACVRFARAHDLPLSIRGGGHNVAGNAVCDGGLMLHMGKLRGVRVDVKNRTATAQPGVTLGDYDRATTSLDLVTPVGVVSGTGIAGLTLGGGLGWLMGKYGLACDNLIGAEVVTAEGKIVQASETENADLLWGLRGGGGNFGVVTEFRYRLYPLEPTIAGLLIYPLEKSKEVLRFFREITPQCPDELAVAAALLNTPDGLPACGLVVCYNGDPKQGEKVLAPIRAFGPPVADAVGPVPFIQHQSLFDPAYPPGRFHYWKAGFMNALPEEAMEVAIEHFARRPSPMAALMFEHMHGAASRVPAEATAFAHRFNHYNFSAFGVWENASDNDVNRKWVQDFWQAARPYLSGRAYVNYLSQEGADRVREAYGPNYERLATLKKKYDPTNFFRLNQNIPPAN
ncbi:MAG TPA: FAD-binding oxidoreductase [Terriglobales bacterium]|nr:FAD-binding oxidoreductase [Terriglobales bacterium]